MKNEFLERFRNHRQHLPLLTSECPGWICYAEKTQGEYIIPYISRVKSPQQILGSLVKRNKSQNIYHLSVQPCYDKKLEASRQDFYDEQRQQYDIDCVISTGIINLIENNVKFSISGEFDKWLIEEQFDSQFTSELDYDEPYVTSNFNRFILRIL
jgi:iron only hydrogenase large subunit-like protein